MELRRRPLVLIKNATPLVARDNAEEIAGLARHEAAARDVLAVVAHEDCDELEPADARVAQRIEQALEEARCPGTIIAATPAWGMETWWMVPPSRR